MFPLLDFEDLTNKGPPRDSSRRMRTFDGVHSPDRSQHQNLSPTSAMPSFSAPLLSVVIPVRNSAASLRVCLESIRRSTYNNYEVVVVDDASIETQSDRIADTRVRWFSLPNQQGPAAARNYGATNARGEYLLFIDADVRVHPNTLTLVVETLTGNPSLDAVFGSYDRHPPAKNFFSQYKNLLHHFVHQQGAEEASTFWSGCGAIRRGVFFSLGGFNTAYRRPCIEDIELGVHLRKAGGAVRLRRDIQVTHLKHWTFWSVIKADVRDRGIPWTRLILREKTIPNDLNLTTSHRISALLSYGLLSVPTFPYRYWGVLIPALLFFIVTLNFRLYLFFARERAVWFALRSVVMHIFYYLYSGGAFVCGVVLHLWDTAWATMKRNQSP